MRHEWLEKLKNVQQIHIVTLAKVTFSDTLFYLTTRMQLQFQNLTRLWGFFSAHQTSQYGYKVFFIMLYILVVKWDITECSIDWDI